MIPWSTSDAPIFFRDPLEDGVAAADLFCEACRENQPLPNGRTGQPTAETLLILGAAFEEAHGKCAEVRQ